MFKIFKRAVAAVATGGLTEVARLAGQKSAAQALEAVFTDAPLQVAKNIVTGSPPQSVAVIQTPGPMPGGSGGPATAPVLPSGFGGGGPVAFGQFGSITGGQSWLFSARSTPWSPGSYVLSDNRGGSWVASGTSVRRL